MRTERRPFPSWGEYRRNSIWIYDVIHFHGCPRHAVFAVMYLVTREWICELVSIEETSTQVQVVFTDLELEGLVELIEARQDQPGPGPPSPSMPTLTFSGPCCSPSQTTGRR